MGFHQTSYDDRFTLQSDHDGDRIDNFDQAFIDSAGGAGAHDLDGSSSSELEDTDLLVDNISDLLKSCFRKKMGKSGVAPHDHKRQRT